MFKDAVEVLFTPTTKIARKYGFLHQSLSLNKRFERCKTAWLPHLKSCQELFLAVAQPLPKKYKVVVLGSAHLHEIPLHLLLEQFQQVVLVDVIHPLKHHSLAKKNSRLQLITQDLGGMLEGLSSCHTLGDLEILSDQTASKEVFSFEADLIVSGNLLSQLALLPLDYIGQRLKRPLSLEEKDHFCSWAAQVHLQNLKNCRGEILVYADREVIYRDPSEEVLYQGQYVVDFAGFNKIKEWTWMLAPLGEASKKYAIEMRVEAYQISGK